MAMHSASRFMSAFILSMAASAPFSHGSEPSLDDLRAQLAEQLSSISAIDCTFTIVGSSSDTIMRWTWKEDRDRQLVTCEPVRISGKSILAQEWFSFDGEHGYEVSWDTEDPTRILAIRRLTQPSEFLRLHLRPDMWMGRVLSNSSETLLTLLAGDQAMIVEVTDIDGHSCVHVDLGIHKNREKYLDHWGAWLDLEHEALPRKLHFVRTKMNSDDGGDPVIADDVFSVIEFQWVHDAGLDIQRWYPMRMRHAGIHGANELAVESLTLNQPIPKEAFIPEPDFGTEIYDDPPLPGQTRQVTIHGGEAAITARRERLLEQSKAMSQKAIEAEGPPIDARPLERSWALIWLPWTSLVVIFGTAGWIFWSRRP